LRASQSAAQRRPAIVSRQALPTHSSSSVQGSPRAKQTSSTSPLQSLSRPSQRSSPFGTHVPPSESAMSIMSKKS